MVSVSASKELPNVLPKGNPFVVHIEYHIYGALYGFAVGKPLPPRTLTTDDTQKSNEAFAACSAFCAF